MSDAITVSLSRQSGLLRELAVVANNIANVSTDGFKREAAVFAEFVSSRASQPSVSLGSLRGHFPDLTQGSLKQTGATYDLAIDGEGWFAVARRGELLLTRGGSFTLDAEGQMVTPDGYPVVDDGGSPIVIPESARNVVISTDGTVTADEVEMAQVGVLTTDAESLSRVGENLWRTNGAIRFADFPVIRQGFVEASNVRAVEEIARLIEVQRMYEAGAALQTDDHERISSMIEALGGR
ncbi:MAG: flagellar basal-body rod protein FlgF [Parvularculaceae bacterium]|nr:flagellar basal-body rod protein FlgF [Parvularculaceae bacterium]